MFHVRGEVQDAVRSLADSFDELLFILKDLPPEEQQKYCNAEVLGPMSAFLNRAEPFEPIWRDKPTVQTLVSSFPEEIEEEIEEKEVEKPDYQDSPSRWNLGNEINS